MTDKPKLRLSLAIWAFVHHIENIKAEMKNNSIEKTDQYITKAINQYLDYKKETQDGQND